MSRWKILAARGAKFAGYVPLAPAGLLVLIAASAAIYFRGLARLDLVALAAGIGVICILALAMITVVVVFFLSGRRLDALDQPSSLELVSGKEVFSGFSVPMWTFVPLLQWNWNVQDIEADTKVEYLEGRLREHLTCRRRGLLSALSRKFTLSDTLGLVSMSWTRTLNQSVRILPHPGKLDQPDILLSLVSGEDISDPRGDPTGDRVDMRQYQRGDPMKFILWKVYSRSGRVMVRVPERALAARPRACCYLLSGPLDEPSAAIARVLLEYRMLGEGWRFGADGRSAHTGATEEALNRVAESGNVSDTSTRGLVAFMAQAEQEGFGFCLILAPPGDADYAKSVLDAAARTQMHTDVWIGMDLDDKPQTKLTQLLQKLSGQALDPAAVSRNWQGRASIIERESGALLARSTA